MLRLCSGIDEIPHYHKLVMLDQCIILWEVFRICDEGWSVETIAKDIDILRRIFQENENPREKQYGS